MRHSRGRFWSLFVATLVVGGACGAAPPAPPGASAPQPTLTHQSAHFVFRHLAADSPHIAQTAATLEASHARIAADLSSGEMPMVNVTFYRDHAALVAGAGSAAGPIPTWATGLITAQDQIHMISPTVAGPYDRAVTNLVHEFAHCVSMRVNQRIPNNPRWLWEAVAIYEAGQRVDLRTLSYMTAGQPPPFSRLNSLDNGQVYELGYSIAEFVVDRFGLPKLRELIVSNGDTVATLGMDLAEFERQWYAAVRDTYGL